MEIELKVKKMELEALRNLKDNQDNLLLNARFAILENEYNNLLIAYLKNEQINNYSIENQIQLELLEFDLELNNK